MNLKENKLIKTLLDRQKELIELFFVAIIGGWVIGNIFTGSFFNFSAVAHSANVKMPVYILLLAIGTAIVGAIYYFRKTVGKLLLLGLVMLYFVLCAYNTNGVDFSDVSKNPIGDVCLLALMGFLAVAVFVYVREDIFRAAGRFKLSNKALMIITGVVGVLIFGIVTTIGVMRYLSYSNATFDFGIFAQAYEYMKQTGTITTTVERGYEVSHYANHFSPIFYIGLPLYFIFPSAQTVAVIQAIMVALPVIPIYLLGKHFKLKNKVIFALIALYALYPATIAGTFYDIHENTFITFTLLMFIWAVEKKKNIPTIIFLLLTFAVKEDAPMYIMLLGAFWLFSRRDKKRGIIFILVSAIYFVIALAIVNSYGHGIMDFRYSNMFYDPKGGLGQIIVVLLTNPVYALNQVVANADAANMDKIGYIITMFAPISALIFSAQKHYSRYILLGTLFVLSLITTYPYQHDIGFQYNFGHIALFIYIIIMNLTGLSVRKQKTRVWAGVIISLIMFMGLVAPRGVSYIQKYNDSSARIEACNEALALVPRDAKVVTTGFLMPHLSRNLQLYDIGYPHELTDEKGNVTSKEYATDPDYIVIDSIDSAEMDVFNAQYLNSGNYELINGENNVVKVYKKK